MSNFEYNNPSTPSRSKNMRFSLDSPFKQLTPDKNRRFSSPVTNLTSKSASTGQRLSTSTDNSFISSPMTSDRFIPNRASTNLEEGLDILNSIDNYIPSNNSRLSTNNINISNTSGHRLSNQSITNNVTNNPELFNQILRYEILGEQYSMPSTPNSYSINNESDSSQPITPTRRLNTNLLRYSQSTTPINSTSATDRLASNLSINSGEKFTLSSVKTTPNSKPLRKISKAPYKVLEAPSLYDDYYLNLLDWSSQNVLAVALGNSVYLWSACTSKVGQLCDLSPDAVTSLTWSVRGDQLAIGTNNGKVNIWDIAENKIIREIRSHTSRVGVMSWSSQLLASGSRDRHIYCYDLRIGGINLHDNSNSNSHDDMDIPSVNWSPRLSMLGDSTYSTILSSSIPISPINSFSQRLNNVNDSTTNNNLPSLHNNSNSNIRENCIVYDFNSHKQEVCGLKWSFDEKLLASGGNDNKLFIWSVNQSRNFEPLYEFSDHQAAVKAVAWSPHQSGIIASGGGTADRHIRFWNALNGSALHKVDTGSQVCNLLWSKNVNELVSTHGYSLNQVIIWKYPTMQKLATLTGHTLRVLYLAGSPDGKSIVTGAGDETLRFWNVFPGSKNRSGNRIGPSVLIPSLLDIR